jgi:predicted DNA-binding WGR domain protein
MFELDAWSRRHWQKAQRTYTAELVQDLFGQWQVVRSWGSIGTRRGNRQTLIADSQAEALALLEDTATRRAKRGYQEVSL